jgi:CheY-like chemotaxis protein
MRPLILIIDDDALFVETYADLLEREGYRVESVPTADAARRRITTAPAPDAVIVDLKLQGAGGPDEGLDLLGHVVARLPGTPVLLATAYISADAIQRAFRAGATDVLEKHPELFDVYLRIKLQNALQLRGARRLAAEAPEAREAHLRALWEDLQRTTDALEKGPLLERVLQVLLSTIPGFVDAGTNRQNRLEEIDVLVRNESTDAFLARQGDYLLVECKNWSSKVGVPEVTLLLAKLEHRYGRCNTGILVAPGGFASSARQELLARRKGRHLLLLLDGDDLSRWVHALDRAAELKRLFDEAVV